MHKVFHHHDIPNNIINDHGPQFISKFWKHFFTMLKVFCKLSSGYHPQTNGQTECTNQTLEHYLRCFNNHQLDDWVDFLNFSYFA